MSAKTLLPPEQTATENQTVVTQSPPRIRLEFLDGIRGIAALYVAIGHAFQVWLVSTSLGGSPLGPFERVVAFLFWHTLRHVHYAVDVFIVLSGFCLMLPVVRAQTSMLKDGILGFAKRRAWRILPPYYAALAGSLLIIAAVGGMNLKTGAWWDHALPALSPGVILSHLFLVHNHSGAWESKINSPMWSIAVEWQIYFLFALFLLPVWRRLGNLAAVCAAILVSVGSYGVLNGRLGGTYPWMLGLFAVGMAGAAIAFGGEPKYDRWRQVRWGRIAGILCTIAFVFAMLQRKSLLKLPAIGWIASGDWKLECAMDFVVGIAAVSFILHCILRDRRSQPAGVMSRVFNARPARTLGAFSYSLYLTHAPVLALIDNVNRKLGLQGISSFMTVIAIGVPATVAVAYMFYLVFERPFISGSRRVSQVAVKPEYAVSG
jgi:peptidoglycan/LPS O-acetylase OafA/YrhL